MSDIRTTVLDTLNTQGYSQYARYAEPVIAALVQREHEAVAFVIDFAIEKGLPESDAIDALDDAGFEVPSTEQADEAIAVSPNGDGSNEMLARIDATLQGLVGFARRHGFNG